MPIRLAPTANIVHANEFIALPWRDSLIKLSNVSELTAILTPL
jgi:hypothetical protein